MEKVVSKISPQPGYQEDTLSSPADIVIGGAAAGVGKTYALLLEFLRHIENPEWGGVIFRRTSPQIKNEGGLWDTSTRLYPLVGGEPRESSLEWKFRKGAKMKFSHLEYEKNVLDWQGSQIPFIGFDELTHFSEYMFFYLLSRNRSTCGVRPYVRATCNPDPDSWVYKLIEWWIGEDGFPIKERNGVIRYFIKDGGNYIWGDSKAEVIEKAWYMLQVQVEASGIDPQHYVKSITFISGSIYDNKELLKVDPGYLANLNALDPQEKSMLLDGNWKIVISENELYDYPAFIGMFDNVYDVDRKNKYITADIAMEGSDKFIVGAWDGDELVDVHVMGKNNGKEVVDVIKSFATKYRVPNRNIVYDADGVGSFVGGFIPGSQAFNNNGAVISAPGKPKENYQNLKTQCFYKSAKKVNDGLIKVSEYAANKMYDDKMTVRQRLIHERKAIKKDKMDMEGKLQIIPKKQMKTYLDGQSPDMMDMFMMRSYFDLQPERKIVAF